tara:strand:+ start:1718 stop:2377 length:660 start_codon:yes stop_codon:yes gene_type:complete
MKVAIIYRGEYFRTGEKATSFFDVVDNHQRNFHARFENVDLFFETRNTSTEHDSKLKYCLTFKKYNFNNDNKTCIDSIINSLKIHDFSEYDFVISTRFDLYFNDLFSRFRIDFNKYNFLWREPPNLDNGMPRVCDHMIGFPGFRYNQFFKIDLEDDYVIKPNARWGFLPQPDQQSHHINQFLHIDLSDINFMLDGMTLKSGHEYEEPEIAKRIVLLRHK